MKHKNVSRSITISQADGIVHHKFLKPLVSMFHYIQSQVLSDFKVALLVLLRKTEQYDMGRRHQYITATY